MKICYLCSSHDIEKRLKHHFGARCELKPFSEKIEDYTSLDAVLIIEPYECKGKNEIDDKAGPYMSVFAIWKRYLAHLAPDIKLLVAGFNDRQHPNFIPLLELNDAYPLEEKVQKAYKPQDDWEDEIPCLGEPAEERLVLFFNGHHNEGMVNTLAQIRQSLNHADEQLRSCDSPENFIDLWKNQMYPAKPHRRMLFSRWHNYCPFFECMPFFHQLNRFGATEFIGELNELFQGRKSLSEEEVFGKTKAFKELNPYNRFDQLQTLLDHINKRYVQPEIVGRVLVVDDDLAYHHRLENAFPTFQFDRALDGDSAMARLKNKAYDFVILDLMLDDSSDELEGLSLISSIKENASGMPLIVASTHTSGEVYRQALQLGADAFLKKPEYDRREWERLFLRAVSGKTLTNYPFEKKGAPRSDKAKILVVEDEDQWYQTHILGLKSHDYEFIRAISVQAAKDILMADQTSFDLVLLDLFFKENGEEVRKGLELIPLIVALDKNLPIIVITRDQAAQTARDALNKRASDYLRKDRWDPKLWQNRFGKYIELRRLRKVVYKYKLQFTQ